MFLCMTCSWYDNDNGECRLSPVYNDPDTGKTGQVVECGGYVEIDNDDFWIKEKH